MSSKSDLSSLIEARPELVSTLNKLLDHDAEQDTWQPADVGIDETALSTLVDSGHVRKVNDGYQFTDPAVVRTAVDQHHVDTDTEGQRLFTVRAALFIILALVVLVRSPTILDVFRGDWIVLVSNDPYFYRYLVDQSLASGTIPSVPDQVTRGEPLLVATLAVAAWPFGAGTWGSGFVVTWYPVVAAVLTTVLVYGAATRLTDDARVGLAAAGLLAVTPAHAYRSALGVADHHAFDYLWLSLTAFAVITLLRRSERDRRTWLATGALAVGVAAQALAWEAAPLLLFPLAPALALVGLVEIRRPDSERLTPVAIGLVSGAIVAHGIHLLLGWQSAAVIYALGLLAFGSVGLLGLVRAIRRINGSWLWLAAGEAVLAIIAVVAIRRFPLIWPELQQGLRFFLRAGPAELAGVGSTYGVVGVILFLGYASVLAVPTLLFAAKWGWQRLEPAWLVAGVYVIHFGVLTALQRRFGGELAPFAAILGGVGFILLASWFDLVSPPVPRQAGDQDSIKNVTTDDELIVPDRTRIALLAGLAGVAVGSGSLYTALMSRRIVIDDATYEAARWISEYSAEHSLTYPQNYVLSKWGRNRVYNYFVNGEASSYGYAERNYEEFLFSTDADEWYEQFADRVGFVVTRDLPHLGLIGSSTVQSTLHDRFGGAARSERGVGHFRILFATDDGARKVFRVVPGATISGATHNDPEQVQLVADVSIPGADFEYVRRASVTDGTFEVTVANPGTYRIGDDGRTVTISEQMVRTGVTLSVE
jgi:dolichyl-diphosphooligosaccharide--protein glycosyltransferase